jgi:hypothetical protein
MAIEPVADGAAIAGALVRSQADAYLDDGHRESGHSDSSAVTGLDQTVEKHVADGPSYVIDHKGVDAALLGAVGRGGERGLQGLEDPWGHPVLKPGSHLDLSLQAGRELIHALTRGPAIKVERLLELGFEGVRDLDFVRLVGIVRAAALLSVAATGDES